MEKETEMKQGGEKKRQSRVRRTRLAKIRGQQSCRWLALLLERDSFITRPAVLLSTWHLT